MRNKLLMLPPPFKRYLTCGHFQQNNGITCYTQVMRMVNNASIYTLLFFIFAFLFSLSIQTGHV